MRDEYSDRHFMMSAIRIAAKGAGRTSPNPMVGALIVKDGVVLGQGYHKRAGEPHAEINAINASGAKARGAELYINLEPCSHFGRTPPCADSVITSGIARVVIAMKDPNPKVAGRGIEKLKRAGIEVEVGILEEKAKKLNEVFIKHVTTGLPFVTMKAAVTLDGCIATRTGESKWITGEASRRHVHRIRARTDAILVGIGTVKRDDPSLTTRLARGRGKSPVRVVLDEALSISPSARVMKGHPGSCLIIATTDKAPTEKIEQLKGDNVKIIVYNGGDGLIPLRTLMKDLGSLGIASLIIEGGSEVNASAMNAGIVDKVTMYYAPRIMGGKNSIKVVGGAGIDAIADAVELENISIKHFDDDFLVEGYIKKRNVNPAQI